MSQENHLEPKVAIIQSENHQNCLSMGLEKLGGIGQFIKEGDVIFLKITLRLPFGFPNNSDLDLVKELIEICQQANPKKIYIGSYPIERIPLSIFDEMMGLEDFISELGANFVYLDNSDVFNQSKKSDELKAIKDQNLEKINLNEEKLELPKIVMECDKIINLNQVNVSPFNLCGLSLENQFSILPNKYRDLFYDREDKTNIVENDLYREDLTNKILNTYLIKKPILTINDLYYILENAGPNVYKDSNLKRTNLMVLGTDSIAVDVITLMLMNLETSKSSILVEAVNRDLGPKLISDIEIIGENIEENNFEINLCKTNLTDIRIQNIHTHCGEMCSGCNLKAYHLLNIIKTYLVKDLKYIKKNDLLIGLNPPKISHDNNIILFGDCAIKTTKDYEFRTITKKTLIRKNEKEVRNKDILEITGCPPNLNDTFKELIDYFGKKTLPNLNYFLKLFKKSRIKESKDKLKMWEDLNE